MLSSVAEFYEEDVSTRMTALLSLIEPAIMIFMGIFVAFVLVALYLPIFSLADTISNNGNRHSQNKGPAPKREQAQPSRERYRCEFVDLKTTKIDHELFRTVPVDLMFRYHFVPLHAQNGTLEIALSDPRQIYPDR